MSEGKRNSMEAGECVDTRCGGIEGTLADRCMTGMTRLVAITGEVESLYRDLGGSADQNKCNAVKSEKRPSVSVVEIVETMPELIATCASRITERSNLIQDLLHGKDDVGFKDPVENSATPEPSKAEKITDSYKKLDVAIAFLSKLTYVLVGTCSEEEEECGKIGAPTISSVLLGFPRKCDEWVEEASSYINSIRNALL